MQTVDHEFANLRAACRWSMDTDGGQTALQLLATAPHLRPVQHADRTVRMGRGGMRGGRIPGILRCPPCWRSRRTVRGGVAIWRVQLGWPNGPPRPKGLHRRWRWPSWHSPRFPSSKVGGKRRLPATAWPVPRRATAEDTFFELLAEADIAVARAYSGDAAAVAAADEVCARAEALDAPLMVAYASFMAGETRLEHSPQEALPLLRRAVKLARSAGDRFTTVAAGLSATSVEVRHGDPEAALADLAGLLDEWQRAGAWNPTWLTLRLCIDVFVWLGEHESAAQLLGAMHASNTASPAYGADAKRIASAETTLRSALASYDASVSKGAALGDDGAVTLARHTLRNLMRSAGRDY